MMSYSELSDHLGRQRRIIAGWAKVATSTNLEDIYDYVASLESLQNIERRALTGSRTSFAERSMAQGTLRMASIFSARANARLRTLGLAEYVFRRAGEPGSAFMGRWRNPTTPR